MCKKHWAVSANLKKKANNINIIGLKSKNAEMPNASYPNRCLPLK
jgi:hypothetical protein